MNANELKNHLRETMRGDIAAHLREVHGLTEVPKTKQGQAKLHGEQDHGDAPAKDAAAEKDVSVLAGVTRKPEETKPATPKPVRRSAPKPATAKAPAAKPATKAAKPATKAAPKAPATRTRPAAKATPKPASPAPKAEANGTSTREHNQTVARRLASLAAEAFKNESPETKAKVAYWLHSLPTGSQDGTSSGSWNRWFPESLPRPETADWRAPA